MIDRFTHLFKARNALANLKAKARALFTARSEVDINAHGTQGYMIKHGPNKGKILAHHSPRSNRNW